jgi:hypothetical protein
MPDPNINFASFVLSLAATAAVHFGDRLEPGETEQGPVDLQAAGQMIDILALLEEKTRGNLTAEERELLEAIPTSLARFAAQVSKESSRPGCCQGAGANGAARRADDRLRVPHMHVD